MLSEIVRLVKMSNQISLKDIAIHFRMESSAVEPMMDILLRKGRVRLFGAECSSDSCSGCSCSSRESMLLYTTMNDEIEVKPL
ncbi:MAG: sugar metabolism transcriptional regulator [Candidatus Sabulitectum sp.]|nr:sugar metabolism transcriptional regulator [Candidatus Sabulitectum sp.]